MSSLALPFLMLLAAAGGLALVGAAVFGLLAKVLGNNRGLAVVAIMLLVIGTGACGIGTLGCVKTQRTAWWLKEPGLRRVAARAEPLIDALRRFEAEHGRPPERLKELTVKHLERIPGTGWNDDPSFEYEALGDGTWRLWVSLPKLLGRDEFVYDPEVMQPGLPGVIYRVGDWYYLLD